MADGVGIVDGYVPAKDIMPKNPYRVFLWCRLVKYRENTNRYRTEIPNRDATLVKSELPVWTFFSARAGDHVYKSQIILKAAAGLCKSFAGNSFKVCFKEAMSSFLDEYF